MMALPRIIRPAAALGGVAYDPDAAAYFAAMSIQPDATRKGLINDYIVGLKADGVWSLLDLVYILASHDEQAARLNAKVPASNTITVAGTVTFTTDRGYTGNGTNGYLETGRALNAGGNYAQNSASTFSWINSSTGTTQSLGTWYSGSRVSSLPDVAAGFTGRVNQTSDSTFGNPANRLGSRCISRTGATTTNGQVNGVASGSTSTVASTSLNSTALTLLGDAANFNGLDRLALAALGGGLTGTQMTALHDRSSTFLTAIGAN